MDSVARDLQAWLAQMPDVDPEVEAARQRIGRLSRQFTRMLDSVAAHHQITVGDWEALSVVARSVSACTPTTLAEELGLTSGTISTRLNRLNEAGLVEVVSASDGRSRPVRLTSLGHHRWREATATRAAREKTHFSALDPAELTKLNTLLGTLLQAYEERFGPASRHDRTGEKSS